jgi:hypothetical protein
MCWKCAYKGGEHSSHDHCDPLAMLRDFETDCKLRVGLLRNAVRQTLKQVQSAVPAARFTRGSTKYQHTAVKEKLDKLKALESDLMQF